MCQPSAQSFSVWQLPITCLQVIRSSSVALCGLRKNRPVSTDSLPLLSGINQAIQLSAFLSRHNLIVYRKRPCISRPFFHKIEAKNQGCGLFTSVFGVLRNLINIHKTS